MTWPWVVVLAIVVLGYVGRKALDTWQTIRVAQLAPEETRAATRKAMGS